MERLEEAMTASVQYQDALQVRTPQPGIKLAFVDAVEDGLITNISFYI